MMQRRNIKHPIKSPPTDAYHTSLSILAIEISSNPLRKLLHNNLIPPIPKRAFDLLSLVLIPRALHQLLRHVLFPRLTALLRNRRRGLRGQDRVGDGFDAGDRGAACDERDYLGEGWGVGRFLLGWGGGSGG